MSADLPTRTDPSTGSGIGDAPTRVGNPGSAATPGALVGEVLGKYRLLCVLGRGGMGEVYEAEDAALGRRVAVKILPERLAAGEDSLRRFQLEARSAARVQHPNVVTVFDVGEARGLHFIAMELVRGMSAADFLNRRGRFNWPEALRITADACRGMDAAHRAGLIHRDIKPANIMRGMDGTVKLADFGLAKANDAGEGLTGTGDFVGTPQFMSPEQCYGLPLDARSDIYSMGVTLYTLLAGESPFGRMTGSLRVMEAHCSLPLPDLRQSVADVPDAVCRLLERATAKKPEDRFQTAAAMSEALEAVLSGRTSTGRGEGEWTSMVAALESARAKASVHVPARTTRSAPGAAGPGGGWRSGRAWLLPGVAAVVAMLGAGAYLVLNARNGAPDGRGSVRPPSADTAGPPDPAPRVPPSKDAPLPKGDPAPPPQVRAEVFNALGMPLIRVPAGTFRREGRLVRITRPLLAGVHEVTQREYLSLMGTNPSRFRVGTGGGPDHPVEQVTWDEAVAFCRKLSDLPLERIAGRRYRLPTEAEWEHLCRAGTATEFWFGDAISSSQANFNGEHPFGGGAKGPNLGRTTRVGSYQANPFGLHDVHGNVYEWCADWYDEGWPQKCPEDDPPGPAVSPVSMRCVRGGSWFNGGGGGCLSRNRGFALPDGREATIGFRVVCDVP